MKMRAFLLPPLLAIALLVPDGAGARSLLPKSGQKGCWSSAGGRVGCNGTGHDGDDRAGFGIRLVDGGNGTLTDGNTRLVWEKLSRDGGLHERNTAFTWDQALAKVVQLNTPPCFAGICTWRLPNVKELLTIADFERKSPALAKQFLKKCQPGCTVASCSCTPIPAAGSLAGFWSSTTNRSATAEAFQLVHATAAVAPVAKSATGNARAVAEPTCTKATVTVRVAYATPGAHGSGVTVVLDYPEDLADVPGLGSNPSVLERVTNLTGRSGIFSAGDADSDGSGGDDRLSVGLIDLSDPGIAAGPFAAVEFDCSGGEAPLVTDFACTLDASDLDGAPLPGTCAVGVSYE